jgi:hypothetical protein
MKVIAMVYTLAHIGLVERDAIRKSVAVLSHILPLIAVYCASDAGLEKKSEEQIPPRLSSEGLIRSSRF